jgi:hypothetical protein
VALEGYGKFRTKREKCDVKTAYTDALVIKNAMKWGSKASRGLLKLNPAADWEMPKPVKPKRRCYNAAEVEVMENGVREWLRPVVSTLAWTGLRIGELVNLRWADVDFGKRVIHVRVQEEWKPKGRRDRAIPMHSQGGSNLAQAASGVVSVRRSQWWSRQRNVRPEVPEGRSADAENARTRLARVPSLLRYLDVTGWREYRCRAPVGRLEEPGHDAALPG